jgi:signal peptidase I
MKRWLKRSLIVLAILLGLYVLLRSTFLLSFYRNATGANDPTMKEGQTIWVSNLKKPGKGRFICFRYEDSMFGKQIYIFRMVADAGDTVEMRKGDLFVNGKFADAGYTLALYFKIHKKHFNTLVENGILNEFEDALPAYPGIKEEYMIREDTILFHADQQVLKRLLPEAQRVTIQEDETGEITRQWGNPWNAHHFGPVIVPPGHIFVLGDNRDNARDSRYIGFVKRSDIVATVLGY